MKGEDGPLLAAVEPLSPKAWRQRVEKDLAGRSFDKALVTSLREGVTVDPLYTEADLADGGPDASGYPGLAPFVRGTCPVPGDGWLLGQEYNQSSLENAREALITDLRRGVELAWLGPNLPLQGPDDIVTLLEGAERLAVICDDPRVGFALLAAAEKRNWALIEGGCGWQPFFGGGGADDEHAVTMGRELIGHCRERFPNMRAVTVSTIVHHTVGATVTEELAVAIGAAVEVLRLLTSEEFSVDDVADQILFRFAVADDVFLEMAKLRAARLLWSKVLRAAGAKAKPMAIHARTSPRTRTLRDPWTNLLRGSAECFAAAVGGARSITNLPFDELLGETGVPERQVEPGTGRRWALGAQHVLREEAHLGRVADPAGGSYYLESLTEDLARRAWTIFQEIEKRGGYRAAETWLLDQAAASGRELFNATAKRRPMIVGTSAFPDLTKTAPDAAAERMEEECCRPSALFEQLHLASELWLKETGRRPTALLVRAGSPAGYRPRAAFAADFLAAGGFETVETEPLVAPFQVSEALSALTDSNADIAVLCGADEEYPEIVQEIGAALTQRCMVALAGRPGDKEDAYRAVGIETFMYLGADAVAVLSSLLGSLGEKSPENKA